MPLYGASYSYVCPSIGLPAPLYFNIVLSSDAKGTSAQWKGTYSMDRFMHLIKLYTVDNNMWVIPESTYMCYLEVSSCHEPISSEILLYPCQICKFAIHLRLLVF